MEDLHNIPELKAQILFYLFRHDVFHDFKSGVQDLGNGWISYGNRDRTTTHLRLLT